VEEIPGMEKGLGEYCTIVVTFFPDGAFSYNDMALSFKTKYEQYVADLFLPAHNSTLLQN
jgi:hypothetical protein